MSSLTCQLLRVIGSPLVEYYDKIDACDSMKFYRYALKNRIPLLCLEALNKVGKLRSLKGEYVRLMAKYGRIERAIYEISRKLESWGVNYALFKSIKPYKEVTVDIDILVFGSMYMNVIREMKSAGYNFLAMGPLSVTFRDSKAGVDFDVYDEVGMSRIVYLDKDVLAEFVDYRKLSNGEVVRSLRPEADLLAVIAHSVLKEQMYVLSEYYTTLYYLASMKDEHLNSFLSLADKCKLRLAVKTHIGITAFLHWTAFGKLPVHLVKLVKNLWLNHLELSRDIKKGFNMPYKYHPITIVNAFWEKFKEEKARKSLASQMLKMLDPMFTSYLVDKVLHHIRRKTY